MLRLLPYAGWPLSALIFFLWLGVREDLAVEKVQCNVEKISAIAKSEQMVRKATQRASKDRIAELESMVLDGQKAVDSATAARMKAIVASNEQTITINQLMRDADVEEIPDSSECLNVFIPASAIDGMRLQPRTCSNSRFSRDRGRQVCANPEAAFETDFPSGDFAEITFGDGIILWEMDRATIRSQNAQFEAIGTLNVSE